MHEDYIVRFSDTSNPEIRFICFPYAGGTPRFYRSWASLLPSSAELCAVQLPGRGRHIQESLETSMHDLKATVSNHITPVLDRPSIWFGHSLGAVLAFECLRGIRNHDTVVPPLHLAVSGHVAPHLPDPNPSIFNMSDDELVDEIQRYRGTPDAILNNDDLLRVFLPIVKADLTLLESYDYKQQPVLDCSLSAHYGASDSRVPDREDMDAWRHHTRGSFHFFSYPGQHFFIDEQTETIIDNIFSCVS